jgi:hypothetical protein
VYNFSEYIVTFFIFALNQNGARRNDVFNCFPYNIYSSINQSNHIQHSIIKENLEKQFYLRIKSILKSKLNGNNLIKAVNTYAVPLLTYSFGVIKWSKTNLQNINIQTRVLFTKFCKHHPNSAIERFNLPRENGGRGFSNLEILQHNQIASLKKYFLNRARDNTFLMLWFQRIKVTHL